jgi:Na+/proline symporter
MLVELLDLLIGIVFGFFHKGKEDYTGILRNGAIIGLVIGIIFVLVTIFLAPGSMSISLGFLGMIGFVIEILIFVVIFIAGAFIGDQIERLRHR